MATAPPTDHEARADEAEAAKKVLVITVRGEPYYLALTQIPTKVKLVVRKATGYPIEQFLPNDKIGEDSVVVCWWLSRYLNGEPGLTFDRACDEWDALDLDASKDGDLTIETADADDLKDDAPES